MVGEYEQIRYGLNPPIVVGRELAKVITGAQIGGKPIEIKADNRYKDGNIRIVDGVVRGNKRTVLTYPLQNP